MASYHHVLLSTTLVASALAAEALPSTLELRVDGMVKVKGGELEGARAIIAADDAGTVVLDNGLVHFTYALRLQTRYLFSFEKEGYVTKQVLFDTRVPVEFLSLAPYVFPFQVTLERPPNGSQVEYVGPVGFVRFMPEQEDFGYDTDYRMKDAQPLFERIREFHIAELDMRLVASHVSSPGTRLPAPAETMPTLTAVEEEPTAAPAALDVRRPILEPREVERAAVTPANAPLSLPVPPPIPVPTVVAAPIVKPSTSRPRMEATPLPERRLRPAEGKATTITPTLPRPELKFENDRLEQLFIEPTRVSTVVYIKQGGEVVEYRRVAHRFGPVFFFRNGQSCTARQYEAETGRPASAASATPRGAYQ